MPPILPTASRLIKSQSPLCWLVFLLLISFGLIHALRSSGHRDRIRIILLNPTDAFSQLFPGHHAYPWWLRKVINLGKVMTVWLGQTLLSSLAVDASNELSPMKCELSGFLPIFQILKRLFQRIGRHIQFQE
jgi:hypothetical protein